MNQKICTDHNNQTNMHTEDLVFTSVINIFPCVINRLINNVYFVLNFLLENVSEN